MTPRPNPSFRDIVGQPRALAALRGAIASGRVHHAWIFTGPAGVGKCTTALAFAAALLDPTTGPNLAGDFEPDPDSPTQRMIASGAHPDLHVVTKELARYSSDAKVRERKLLTIPKAVIDEHLLQPIALAASVRSGALASKVFIVDEAERLDRSRTHAPTQNSMLKTLEEPPEGSVLILVTSSEDLLLPTVRSRCQRVVFGELDEAAMDSWVAQNGIETDPDDCRWLLDFAQGSPGKWMLAHEGKLAQWARTLDPLLEQARRGRPAPTLGSTMAALVDDWAKQWVAEHPGASKESANQAGTQSLLGMLAERARRELRERCGSGQSPEPALRQLEFIDQAERFVAQSVSLGNSMGALAASLASSCGEDAAD